MDKNECNSCGKPKCSCGNKDFTKAVIEIDNPGCVTLMRKVVIPASMGDDTTVPPVVGKYHNVLLYYEANQKSYLYSSDGIPTQLVNGVTNYEDAINLPQINGVTLLGDKSSADLKLADAPMVITVADGNTHWSGADTAEDVYDFFLNKGKVNIVFNGGENYAYEIASAAYIPGEEKMMCTLAVATIAAGETSEFEGNALFGTMTLYTANKAIDVSQIELQPKLYIADFTGLDLNYNELSGVPATNASIGMVKPGDGLEVASDGTLSISDIEQYAHFFDTVADMKASEDLNAGDYARTLGFYSTDDGGGALYKIIEKESSTANGNININNEVDAQLINEGVANVKVFGAKGDDSTPDDTAFNNAVAYANSNNVKLYAPKGVYKLDASSINLRNLNIEIEGELNNSYAIILGGDSTNYTNYRAYINKCKDVEVIGLRASEVSIDSCRHVVLSADGNISGDGSIVYCVFNIIDCTDFTITGQNNGWINENVFNIKRCRNFLKITGDGTYLHNNNFFRDLCLEGSNHYIQIDYGHNNYIEYRGEGNPTVTINNPERCYGNVVRPQYAVDIQRIIDPEMFNSHETINVTLPEWLPQYRQQSLVDINPDNYLESNSPVFLHSDGKLHGTNTYACRIYDAPATEAFIIHLRCDTATQRMYITCKDSGGNAVPGNVISRWLTMDESTKVYSNSYNVSDMVAVFLPSDDVATISIDVRMLGTDLSFTKLNVDLFTAFTSNYSMHNTLSGRRKSQNPTSLDANAVWKTGDWVLNRDTEQNQGTFAWVCSAGGTGSGSTWRKITSTTI